MLHEMYYMHAKRAGFSMCFKVNHVLGYKCFFHTKLVAFWSLEVQKAAAKGTPQSHILITSHLVMGLLMTLDLWLGLFMTLGTRGPFTFWWFQTRTA